MADEPYICPNCGNDTFQEAGSVATTTRVLINAPEHEGGKPVFVDYSDLGAQTIWDASTGYFIECTECLAIIDCDGFVNVLPDDEALRDIYKILDGREWSPQDLDDIADIVRRTGKEVRPPNELD